MCGILGYGLVAENPHIIDLATWADTLFHRGPDEYGGYFKNNFALGMRRLSIIDVKNGHQPIFNENKKVIAIFNGQIYNYKDLAEMLKLKGHVLNSNSDGEIIVHLYEEFGEKFVEKLEGMFAIALLDSNSDSIYLYRDRFGKKPLVYELLDNGNLFFASELKSILEIHKREIRDVSTKVWGMYFALGYIPTPNTIFTGISKLPPASYLKWNSGKAKVIKYWNPVL